MKNFVTIKDLDVYGNYIGEESEFLINKFEDKLEKGYGEYVKLPLAGVTDFQGNEIFKNKWCVIIGRGVVDPNPHRHYTFLEFVFWCGKNENLYNRFIK